MNVMKDNKLNPGDIFMIPLYLPFLQEWRTCIEEFIDYKKYEFSKEDIYAFGRFIEMDMGNVPLIEVFQYADKIPEDPDIILQSGRMFKPVYVADVFKRSRWQFLFSNPDYDKWRDSNYGDISFLLYSELWKGGEQIHITQQRRKELLESGVPLPTIHGGPSVELKIRSILKERGIELNYEQIVEERKDGYPKPRDVDRKLKETIAPFGWLSEPGKYSLSLEAGLLNGESFEKYGMIGNGYDWQKIASAYMEKFMPELEKKCEFDCEADTFSMISSSKKLLKDFAVKFHQFSTDTAAFEELLSALK